jgi:DNA-directed RNA polymerase subunit RPC12/RpoP
MHSTGTPPTPERPVGVDTPMLVSEHENEHDEAIHEHIVEHVTRALHREDSGIWSGSDEEEGEEEREEGEGEDGEEGNSDEEEEKEDDEQAEEEEGGVKIEKSETVTIKMSGDNLYMGTGENSSSDEDASSDASRRRTDNEDNEHDATGEDSSAETPSAFASEEETAADPEEGDERGIPIQDSAPPSRRNRETAPSVMMRSINRTVATTMPNPPTRSLTSTAPALPMILQPTEPEDMQVKLPKDRHIADSDLEWMYLAPLDGAKRTVKYICANLGNSGLEEHETEVSFGEPMRCKTCACRVLWKKRTERMVQFEAR